MKRLRSVIITLALATIGLLPAACDAPDAADGPQRPDVADYEERAAAPCAPGLQLELDPATGKPATNADGTLELKYIDAEGGECHAELTCCDVVTLGCFCADTEHGAKCPAGSINPNAPSNGG